MLKKLLVSQIHYLQKQHELCVALVHGNVEGCFVKLAHGVGVGAILHQQLGNCPVPVLGGPVKRRHLQHVFGVHIRPALLNTTQPKCQTAG